MYRKCATEVSVLHQKQVTEGLLELMQKIPYEEITVTQLCQTAGITRRIFYHLFNNKADALYAMIDHAILEAGSYAPALRDEALRFFCYWKDHGCLLDALRSNQLTGVLLERMRACALQEDYDLQYWLKTNGWQGESDVMVFLLCGIMGMTYRWHDDGFRESAEEMAARLKMILTQPLTSAETNK